MAVGRGARISALLGSGGRKGCGFGGALRPNKTIFPFLLIAHILTGSALSLQEKTSDQSDLSFLSDETPPPPLRESRPGASIERARHHKRRGRHQQHGHQRKFKQQDSPRKLRSGFCEDHLNCLPISGEPDNKLPICGSDGRWYESLCELNREACARNVLLIKREQEHCSGSASNGPPLPPVSAPKSGRRGQEERVRIVELKRRCKGREFAEMKSMLLEEFKGNVEMMFKYFDANGDNLIEAHELWPLRGKSGRVERVRYAQLWEEHSQRCDSFRAAARGRRDLERAQAEPSGNNSKCWFYLDFPFEPEYPSNACSLSHLILFELPAGSFAFNLDSLRRAFSSQLESYKRNNKFLGASAHPLRRYSSHTLQLGESLSVNCLANEDPGGELEGNSKRCLWSRYHTNMAAVRDPHVSVNAEDLSLNFREAQLYLSGWYRCQCHRGESAGGLQHELALQVIAKPRVQIRPNFQWSLPSSRVSFECLYDQIETLPAGEVPGNRSENRLDEPADEEPQAEDRSGANRFGLHVEWFNGHQQRILDRRALNASWTASQQAPEAEGEAEAASGENWDEPTEVGVREPKEDHRDRRDEVASLSARASLSMASSRLILENIKLNDSGQISCIVKPTSALPATSQALLEASKSAEQALLLVQDQLPASNIQQSLQASAGGSAAAADNNYLWMFNEEGISIYKLSNDDSQEMELLREINGRSSVNAEVDGNWNQLTLCGGLNSEQAVICEWSDNALQISFQLEEPRESGGPASNRSRKYVYVGQPNLNRVLIMDGELFEIVAIINTEPQPRKLFLYKPNKIHLSKWVRRRLSPEVNRRWLEAIESGHAHPLAATPDRSKLYSERRRRSVAAGGLKRMLQFDVWLLCYGQPLVVSPPEETAAEEASAYDANSTLKHNDNNRQPFTPRLPAANSYAWPPSKLYPRNAEGRIRNRKSVHIIQSSFLPLQSAERHSHESELKPTEGSSRQKRLTVVGQFQHSTVLTTHHIYRSESGQQKQQGAGSELDLIQELLVPPKPFSLELNSKHKLHYSYVTHYNQQSLFRVSMDEYKYDKEIDLQDCDPINLITTAQGLVVLQCRSLITHQLTGQLVLDELTAGRLEFNADVRAQESYLSPDNRYLISVHAGATSGGEEERQQQRQSVIYVQSVRVGGLKLEYEVKTLSLEIGQCSFVWKDGYYAAIFVSSNFNEQQSEILSLRLADGRLELMARVPGLMSSVRRKDQLVVSPKLRLAALTSNRGTYVVDLEENRLIQTLRRHHSPPTLLWLA